MRLLQDATVSGITSVIIPDQPTRSSSHTYVLVIRIYYHKLHSLVPQETCDNDIVSASENYAL